MTTVRYEPDEFRMTISGHAGSGRAGEDLVCAAVTALARTLQAGTLERPEYQATFYENQQAGEMSVQCFPEEDTASFCDYLFRIILCGYRVLAEHYPEYVTVEEETA